MFPPPPENDDLFFPFDHLPRGPLPDAGENDELS